MTQIKRTTIITNELESCLMVGEDNWRWFSEGVKAIVREHAEDGEGSYTIEEYPLMLVVSMWFNYDKQLVLFDLMIGTLKKQYTQVYEDTYSNPPDETISRKKVVDWISGEKRKRGYNGRGYTIHYAVKPHDGRWDGAYLPIADAIKLIQNNSEGQLWTMSLAGGDAFVLNDFFVGFKNDGNQITTINLGE